MSYAAANARGFYADGIHPAQPGANDIFTALVEAFDVPAPSYLHGMFYSGSDGLSIASHGIHLGGSGTSQLFKIDSWAAPGIQFTNLATGRMVLRGINPYLAGPSALPAGDAFLGMVGLRWLDAAIEKFRCPIGHRSDRHRSSAVRRSSPGVTKYGCRRDWLPIDVKLKFLSRSGRPVVGNDDVLPLI